jgi:uncharacterized protein
VRALKLFIGVLLAGWAFAFPATAQESGRIARCVAIQDVNERIDCLEGRGNDPDPPAQNSNRSRPTQAGPSYDCRMATTSIERAICGDPTLADWDLRMGQQYQQALRLRKGPDSQALVASQRSWIQQRNAVCGGVAGTAVWSCVLDMTKQRIAALSEAPPASVDLTPVASPSPFPHPRVQNVPPVAPPVVQRGPDVSTAPRPNAAPQPSSGINPLLVGIFIVGAVIGAIVVFNSIRRREEERRRAAERLRLVAKYGDEIADRILAHTIWQGMTEEQLLESWGGPADKDYEIKKTTTKETWKYQQTGRNRFRNRAFLENGVVIGWKQ